MSGRAPSPLRRLKAAVRQITDGDEPLANLMRANGLRLRIEGDALLLEPFNMDNGPILKRNDAGVKMGRRIEGLANDEAGYEE